MRILRLALTGAGVAALTVTGVPIAAVAAAHPTQHSSTLGDSCLVGTWRSNAGTTSTTWSGQRVTLHYQGGDVDHIAASGTDHDNWAHSKSASGTYRGQRLTEVIRGTNTLRFSTVGKGKVRVTELGWSAGSTNRYVYGGQHSTGYLNQTGHYVEHYRCTAKTLTVLNSKGKVIGTETRLSRKP